MRILHSNNLYLLLYLPIGILLLYLVLRWKASRFKLLADAHLIPHLVGRYSTQKFVLKYGLILVSIFLIILASADIVFQKLETENNTHRGLNIVIALDVSNSMLAQDVPPNRLEAAKSLIYSLISELDNNNVGLVLFAGKAVLQMPVTSDIESAKMYLSTASPSDIPYQGTALAEALTFSNNALDASEKKT